jgi:multiple sugar transport system substrate-binding protein
MTLAAVATGVGLLLSGCAVPANDGSSASDWEGKTLSVLWAIDSRYPQEQRGWFADVSARFEAETGAKVKFETYSSANDELTRIQTAVISGQGPDVYSIGTTFTPTASATGAFKQLGEEEWERVGGRDRFLPATFGMSGPDTDHEVGVPFATRPYVAAYNTRLFAEAGIDAPATNWDGLKEQAEKLTTGGVHGLAIAYADSYDPWKFIWAQSVQSGVDLLDLTTTTAHLDDPAVQTAYENYFSWYTDGLAAPESIGWTSAQALASFAAGESAYMPMTSSYSSATLDASAVADEYAYVTMPTIPPGQKTTTGVAATSMISGDNLVVADYSRQQNLSFAFIEFMTRPAEQVHYFEVFGQLPTSADGAAQIEEQHPELAPLIESAAGSVGTPFTGAWSETQLAVTEVVVQSIPDMSRGSVGAAAIAKRLETAQRSAQAALDKAKH